MKASGRSREGSKSLNTRFKATPLPVTVERENKQNQSTQSKSKSLLKKLVSSSPMAAIVASMYRRITFPRKPQSTNTVSCALSSLDCIDAVECTVPGVGHISPTQKTHKTPFTPRAKSGSAQHRLPRPDYRTRQREHQALAARRLMELFCFFFVAPLLVLALGSLASHEWSQPPAPPTWPVPRAAPVKTASPAPAAPPWERPHAARRRPPMAKPPEPGAGLPHASDPSLLKVPRPPDPHSLPRGEPGGWVKPACPKHDGSMGPQHDGGTVVPLPDPLCLGSHPWYQAQNDPQTPTVPDLALRAFLGLASTACLTPLYYAQTALQRFVAPNPVMKALLGLASTLGPTLRYQFQYALQVSVAHNGVTGDSLRRATDAGSEFLRQVQDSSQMIADLNPVSSPLLGLVSITRSLMSHWVWSAQQANLLLLRLAPFTHLAVLLGALLLLLSIFLLLVALPLMGRRSTGSLRRLHRQLATLQRHPRNPLPRLMLSLLVLPFALPCFVAAIHFLPPLCSLACIRFGRARLTPRMGGSAPHESLPCLGQMGPSPADEPVGETARRSTHPIRNLVRSTVSQLWRLLLRPVLSAACTPIKVALWAWRLLLWPGLFAAFKSAKVTLWATTATAALFVLIWFSLTRLFILPFLRPCPVMSLQVRKLRAHRRPGRRSRPSSRPSRVSVHPQPNPASERHAGAVCDLKLRNDIERNPGPVQSDPDHALVSPSECIHPRCTAPGIFDSDYCLIHHPFTSGGPGICSYAFAGKNNKSQCKMKALRVQGVTRCHHHVDVVKDDDEYKTLEAAVREYSRKHSDPRSIARPLRTGDPSISPATTREERESQDGSTHRVLEGGRQRGRWQAILAFIQNYKVDSSPQKKAEYAHRLLDAVREYLVDRSGRGPSRSNPPSEVSIQRPPGEAVHSELVDFLSEAHRAFVSEAFGQDPNSADLPKLLRTLTRQLRRARTNLLEGYPGKAVRALLQADIIVEGDSFDKLTSCMAALHPLKRVDRPSLNVGGGSRRLDISDTDLVLAIKACSNGAAPGRSGWTAELLGYAAKDPHLSPGLRNFFLDIVNNNLDPSVAERLINCKLIGIVKPDGTYRPIAMGEVFLKVAAHLQMTKCNASIKEHFKDLQFGVACKGGAEVILHRVRRRKHKYILTLDMCNAFNTVHREAIAKELRVSNSGFADLAHLWNLCYSNDSTLFMKGKDDKGAWLYRTLKSEEGARQGDVLGPLLFALAIHPILREAREKFGLKVGDDCLDIFAYLDDITLSSDNPEKIAEAAMFITERMRAIGLIANPTKSHWFSMEGKRDSVPLALKSLNGKSVLDVSEAGFIKILGAYIGNDQAVGRKLQEQTAKHQLLFSKIIALGGQEGFVMLQCAAAKMNYLIRSHHPDLTKEHAEAFDQMLEDTWAELLRICPNETNTRDKMKLPARLGGMGCRRISEIREAAYQASMETALHGFMGCIFKSPKPQKAATDALDAATRARLMEVSPVEAARIKELSSLGGMQLFSSMQFQDRRMNPNVFAAAARNALLIPHRDAPDFFKCSCLSHTEFTRESAMAHVTRCPRQRGTTIGKTHEFAVMALRRTLAMLGVHTEKKEPRDFPTKVCGSCSAILFDHDVEEHYASSQAQGPGSACDRDTLTEGRPHGPDILLVLGSEKIVVDVSIHGAAVLSNMGSSISDTFKVTRAAKHKHYGPSCEKRDWILYVVSCTSNGVMSDEAEAFFNRVASNIGRDADRILRDCLKLAVVEASAQSLLRWETVQLGIQHQEPLSEQLMKAFYLSQQSALKLVASKSKPLSMHQPRVPSAQSTAPRTVFNSPASLARFPDQQSEQRSLWKWASALVFSPLATQENHTSVESPEGVITVPHARERLEHLLKVTLKEGRHQVRFSILSGKPANLSGSTLLDCPGDCWSLFVLPINWTSNGERTPSFVCCAVKGNNVALLEYSFPASPYRKGIPSDVTDLVLENFNLQREPERMLSLSVEDTPLNHFVQDVDEGLPDLWCVANTLAQLKLYGRPSETPLVQWTPFLNRDSATSWLVDSPPPTGSSIPHYSSSGGKRFGGTGGPNSGRRKKQSGHDPATTGATEPPLNLLGLDVADPLCFNNDASLCWLSALLALFRVLSQHPTTTDADWFRNIQGAGNLGPIIATVMQEPSSAAQQLANSFNRSKVPQGLEFDESVHQNLFGAGIPALLESAGFRLGCAFGCMCSTHDTPSSAGFFLPEDRTLEFVLGENDTGIYDPEDLMSHGSCSRATYHGIKDECRWRFTTAPKFFLAQCLDGRTMRDGRRSASGKWASRDLCVRHGRGMKEESASFVPFLIVVHIGAVQSSGHFVYAIRDKSRGWVSVEPGHSNTPARVAEGLDFALYGQELDQGPSDPHRTVAQVLFLRQDTISPDCLPLRAPTVIPLARPSHIDIDASTVASPADERSLPAAEATPPEHSVESIFTPEPDPTWLQLRLSKVNTMWAALSLLSVAPSLLRMDATPVVMFTSALILYVCLSYQAFSRTFFLRDPRFLIGFGVVRIFQPSSMVVNSAPWKTKDCACGILVALAILTLLFERRRWKTVSMAWIPVLLAIFSSNPSESSSAFPFGPYSCPATLASLLIVPFQISWKAHFKKWEQWLNMPSKPEPPLQKPNVRDPWWRDLIRSAWQKAAVNLRVSIKCVKFILKSTEDEHDETLCLIPDGIPFLFWISSDVRDILNRNAGLPPGHKGSYAQSRLVWEIREKCPLLGCWLTHPDESSRLFNATRAATLFALLALAVRASFILESMDMISIVANHIVFCFMGELIVCSIVWWSPRRRAIVIMYCAYAIAVAATYQLYRIGLIEMASAMTANKLAYGWFFLHNWFVSTLGWFGLSSFLGHVGAGVTYSACFAPLALTLRWMAPMLHSPFAIVLELQTLLGLREARYFRPGDSRLRALFHTILWFLFALLTYYYITALTFRNMHIAVEEALAHLTANARLNRLARVDNPSAPSCLNITEALSSRGISKEVLSRIGPVDFSRLTAVQLATDIQEAWADFPTPPSADYSFWQAWGKTGAASVAVTLIPTFLKFAVTTNIYALFAFSALGGVGSWFGVKFLQMTQYVRWNTQGLMAVHDNLGDDTVGMSLWGRLLKYVLLGTASLFDTASSSPVPAEAARAISEASAFIGGMVAWVPQFLLELAIYLHLIFQFLGECFVFVFVPHQNGVTQWMASSNTSGTGVQVPSLSDVWGG